MPRLKLEAELGLKKTGFDAGITAANKQVERFGKFVAGAFSITAVLGFAKSIIDLGGSIKDATDRLGVGVRDVQEFGLAAKLGGQDASVFARAIEKVRIAMAEGKNPLAAFGITMREMQSGDAVGILRKLADALDDFGGNADQTKALADTFGAKGMGAIVNMLRELPAAKDNLTFTKEEVNLLDAAGDAWTKILNNIKVGAARAFLNTDPRFFARDKSKEKEEPPKPIAVENLEAQAKAQEDLAKLREKTDDLNEKNRIAQLTDEERLNELLLQRAELYRQLQFALNEQTEATIRNKIAQSDADIISVEAKFRKPKQQSHIETSQLGQIGAFSGGGINQNGPQLQGLQSLRRIESALIQKGIIVRDVK